MGMLLEKEEKKTGWTSSWGEPKRKLLKMDVVLFVDNVVGHNFH
jgi:hypothetical protein